MGANVNLPKNSRLGLDLSMDWDITDSIRSGVSYEYVKARSKKATIQDQKFPWFPKGY